MKRKLDPFKLGVFVLCGAAIVVGGLAWIGAAHFFENRKTYVTFFDKSVGGLNTGSDVKRLGLKIGRVSAISLAQNERLVKVEMKINSDFQVQKGEAVEIQMAGITGGHYLAIVDAPPNVEKVTPKIDFPTRHPVIPSVPGTLATIESSIEGVFKKLGDMNAGGFLSSWADVGKSANKVLSNKDIEESLQNFREASASLKNLVSGISKPETVRTINAGINDFAAAASSARKAGGTISTQVEAIPPKTIADVTERVDKAAKETETAAGAVNAEVSRTLLAFQQSAFQFNQVLSEMHALVHSLREEPGRVLKQPRGKEPFGK